MGTLYADYHGLSFPISAYFYFHYQAAGGGQSQAPTESVVSSEAYSGSTKELEGFSELEPEKEVSIPGSGRFICGYEILDTLGKGMSGKVKRGRSKEGKHVALKIIDKVRIATLH